MLIQNIGFSLYAYFPSQLVNNIKDKKRGLTINMYIFLQLDLYKSCGVNLT